MEMEDESILLGMLSEETKQLLLNTLSVEQQNELFFYQHFNLKEKTDMDTKKFVSNLADDYYEQNNQYVPFAKIEDGYVQCIQDPHVEGGFITVQITNRQAKTANTRNLFKKKNNSSMKTKDITLGEDFYELETDEAREAQLNKTIKNDTYRLVENRYGHLKETDPNAARNAEKIGIISFW